MKMFKLIAMALVFAMVVAEKTDQAEEEAKPKPKGWYTKWVMSEENPYVQSRVRELSKLLYILPNSSCANVRQKNLVADDDPKGWFKKFVLDSVRASLYLEARAAYKARKLARGETTAWNKYSKLNFS